MSYYGDHDSSRVMITRVELVETKDDEGQQRVTVRGLHNEVIKHAHRLQMFGETSHAPPGAHGLLLSVGGRRDQAVLFGLEHETHRPRNLAQGDRAIYDAHGNIISLVQQNIRIVGAAHVHITANGGNVEITGSAQVNVRAPQINLN